MEDTSSAVATPSAPSSAPASSSAPTSAERPTFAQAFASDAAGSPPATPPSASTTPPAAVQPGGAQESTPSPDREPFIPRQRFDEVNTRMQTAEQKLQALAWAQGVDPQQFQTFVEAAQAYQRNPIEFLQRLDADPQHGPALRSHYARELARRQQAQQPEPPPDLVAENGAGVYSAQQLAKWRDWNNRNLQAQWRQEMQPVQQFAQTAAEREFKARLDAHAQSQAAATLKDAQSWPGFADKKNQAAIKAAMEADRTLDFPSAYIKVVVPTLSSKAQETVMADLQSRAAAATVNPSSPAATTTRKITSFRDPSLKWG